MDLQIVDEHTFHENTQLFFFNMNRLAKLLVRSIIEQNVVNLNSLVSEMTFELEVFY